MKLWMKLMAPTSSNKHYSAHYMSYAWPAIINFVNEGDDGTDVFLDEAYGSKTFLYL